MWTLPYMGILADFKKKIRTLPKGFSKLKNTSFLKYKNTHNTSKKSTPPHPPNVAKIDFKSISVEIAIYLLNLCLSTNLLKMEDQNSKFKIISPLKM
jgi:hypothetical protein